MCRILLQFCRIYCDCNARYFCTQFHVSSVNSLCISCCHEIKLIICNCFFFLNFLRLSNVLVNFSCFFVAFHNLHRIYFDCCKNDWFLFSNVREIGAIFAQEIEHKTTKTICDGRQNSKNAT